MAKNSKTDKAKNKANNSLTNISHSNSYSPSDCGNCTSQTQKSTQAKKNTPGATDCSR